MPGNGPPFGFPVVYTTALNIKCLAFVISSNDNTGACKLATLQDGLVITYINNVPRDENIPPAINTWKVRKD